MLLSTVLVRPSAASSVTVPDQYATIQGAIDSGADTVLVSYGSYPEALSVTNSVALIGLSSYMSGSSQNRLCRVTSIATSGTNFGTFLLRGFEFTGSASIGMVSSSVYVEGCRFDSSLTCGTITSGHLWNNMVFGTLTVNFITCDVAMNTIVGGGIQSYMDGSKSIHDNVVIGPAAIGIRVGEDCVVTNNYVRDCVVGISAPLNMGNWVSANVVEDCSGSGYLVGGGGSTVTNNTARRCGGRGVEVAGMGTYVTGNLVEDVGLEGILAGGTGGTVANNTVTRSGGVGVSIRDWKEHVTGNRVIASGGDGIVVTFGQEVRGNVVGRSAGRGLVIGTWGTPLSVKSNTAYLNTGAGFEVAGSASGDSITGNLAHGNSVGLKWTGSGTPFLSCNDWYANTGGATSGTLPGPTDLAVDPLFCDLDQDDVYLHADSPLLPHENCGTVGALGEGCSAAGVDVPVLYGDAPLTFALDPVRPNPSRGGALTVHFSLPTDAPARLELLDVAGRRIASHEVGVGQQTLDLGADQDLAPGLYLVRLTQGANTRTTRVALLR
jgi:hypothetical protein